MRLFIAICLSEELQAVRIRTMHNLKQQGVTGSYVTAANLHLTLAFLGDNAEASAVKAVMRGLRYKPFRLSLSDFGAFGDTLWIGAKGSQGLTAVVKDIRAALDGAGIAYDRQKFVPHVTLVRHMKGNWRQTAAPRCEMSIGRISLMKSEEKNGKRIYTEIFSI